METNGFKILVYDQSKWMVDRVVGVLESVGYTVDAEYLFYKDLKAMLETEVFDLLILDWDLGIDGFGKYPKTIFDLLGLLSKRTNIILMSHGDPLFLTEAVQKYKPIKGFVRKDEVDSQLVDEVRDLLVELC